MTGALFICLNIILKAGCNNINYFEYAGSIGLLMTEHFLTSMAVAAVLLVRSVSVIWLEDTSETNLKLRLFPIPFL